MGSCCIGHFELLKIRDKGLVPWGTTSQVSSRPLWNIFFSYVESQAIQLAVMDIFLDLFCFLILEMQSFSFASARGIDGCCLELQCYTFFILSVCVCVCENDRVGF